MRGEDLGVLAAASGVPTADDSPHPLRAALTLHAWGLRGWLSQSLYIHSLIKHLPKA